MEEVGDFTIRYNNNNSDFDLAFSLRDGKKIMWPSGSTPKDSPDCGFDGKRCTPPSPGPFVNGKENEAGGAVALWLVCSTPERVVRVRVLAVDIVLCSWARHFTTTVPLSTQVYKWYRRNSGG